MHYRGHFRLILNIGLLNGVLRSVLDPDVTGDLADSRTLSLGLKPLKLFRVMTQNHEAVLAISSRTWLSYYFQFTPLYYDSLEFASGFASKQCLEGVVAIIASRIQYSPPFGGGKTGCGFQPSIISIGVLGSSLSKILAV